MTKNRCSPVSLVSFIAIGAFLFCAVSAQAGGPSAAAGASSNGVTAAVRSVQPAVSGLFQVKAPRVWNNGVPVFLDTWDAFQSRTSSAILKGNSYAFTTIDGLSHEVLYAGVERASSKSPVVFEFSRLKGERSVGDLRIEVEIDNAGRIGTVQFQSYSGDGAKAGLKLFPIAILTGEGCNDAGTACVVANGASLEVGANLSQLLNGFEGRFKAVKITTPENSVVGTFAINPNPDTCNAATDPTCAFYNNECVKEAPANDLNNPACSANDVNLTRLVEGTVVILADKDGGFGCDGESDADDTTQCPSGGDCVTFTATGNYVLTSQSRYDIGTFIGTDLDANGDGAISGSCLRYAYALGDSVNLEPGTSDICGDLDQATAAAPAGVDIPFGPVTVPCIDDGDGNIVINHCETWSQRNNEIDCFGADDVKAGTGSKCNCGVLSGICIAVNSGDACIVNVCQGTCQGGTDPGDTCESNGDCTGGNTCQDIVLTPDPVECADQTDDDCDNPDTCVDGACQPNYEPTTTSCRAAGVCDAEEFCDGAGSCSTDLFLTGECRASSCDTADPLCCDVPENCSGTSAGCPADGFRTGECRAANGICDVAENCTAEGTCPDDGFVLASEDKECRAAGNECDAAEECDGLGPECPADLCGEQVFRVNPFTCTPPAP